MDCIENQWYDVCMQHPFNKAIFCFGFLEFPFYKKFICLIYVVRSFFSQSFNNGWMILHNTIMIYLWMDIKLVTNDIVIIIIIIISVIIMNGKRIFSSFLDSKVLVLKMTKNKFKNQWPINHQKLFQKFFILKK